MNIMQHPVNSYNQPLGQALPEWTIRPIPPKIVINGQYCRLEPINSKKHTEDLYQAYYTNVPDARDWTYLSKDRPQSKDEYAHLVKEMEESTDFHHYAVIDIKSGQAVGTLAFMRIQPEYGVLEIGFVNFSPRLSKHTAATEAVFLMLKYVFDDLGYRRCEWKTDSLNSRSRDAAKRFGFHYEGLFRKDMVRKQRSRDTLWFSMIEDEWPQIKKTYETWLNPNNFDADGNQLTRLDTNISQNNR